MRLRWLLVTVFAAGFGTSWFAWRYSEIGKLSSLNRQQLSASISEAARNDADGSGVAVALTLELNEELFEHTLSLGAIQRTAGVLTLACATILLVAAGAAAREWRRRNLSHLL